MDLRQCFINGLREKYNLTFNDIQKWKYCGGDTKGHLNYWYRCKNNQPLPDHEDHCVCDRKIVRNCYITDGSDIIVIGYCCIKKFMKHSGRTCEICDEPHKNRIDNRCNDCRSNNYCYNYNTCNKRATKYNTLCWECLKKKENNYGKCKDCGIDCNPKFKQCYNCYRKTDPNHGICIKCKTKCNPNYILCYTCNSNVSSKC